MLSGILLLDKPLGLSSNAALQRVRRQLGGVKAGHTGSLDPLASGMLPICIGEATKLAGHLLSGRKCYRFEVCLGESRATGDAEGAVIERCPVPPISAEALRSTLHSLLGRQQQVPPMYSALKKGGQPLYKLARQGVVVERAPREIELYSLECVAQDAGHLDLRTLCSKGTYIRTLAEQIARTLGSCGYVSQLRREYVEPFESEPMLTLEQIEQPVADPVLLPADRALPHLPELRLSQKQTSAIRHGQAVSLPGQHPTGPVRLYDAGAEFFGLGQLGPGGLLRPERLFVSQPS